MRPAPRVSCDLDGVLHALQVRWELIVDGDLADRRADAGNLEIVRSKGLPERVQLALVEVEDVGSPRLRTSTCRRPRPAATLHCWLKSSEISSIKPERVHILRRTPHSAR